MNDLEPVEITRLKPYAIHGYLTDIRRSQGIQGFKEGYNLDKNE